MLPTENFISFFINKPEQNESGFLQKFYLIFVCRLRIGSGNAGSPLSASTTGRRSTRGRRRWVNYPVNHGRNLSILLKWFQSFWGLNHDRFVLVNCKWNQSCDLVFWYKLLKMKYKRCYCKNLHCNQCTKAKKVFRNLIFDNYLIIVLCHIYWRNTNALRRNVDLTINLM